MKEDISHVFELDAEYSWQEFKDEKGPFSIAADGIVRMETVIEHDGPYANFDHHFDANGNPVNNRSILLSAIEQGYERIKNKRGFYWADRFWQQGPKAKIYVGQLDEDNTGFIWLFENWRKVLDSGDEGHQLKKLVRAEGPLDRHFGIYDLYDPMMLSMLAGIYKPLHEYKFAHGEIRDVVVAEDIYQGISENISKYLRKEDLVLPDLDDTFRTLESGNGWTIVEETGPASRLGLNKVYHGRDMAVLIYKGLQDGAHRWTMVDKAGTLGGSQWYEWLNIKESENGIVITDSNKWGGSSTGGGSPKESGSSLDVSEMAASNELFKKIVFPSWKNGSTK